jgi:hypothetical protein
MKPPYPATMHYLRGKRTLTRKGIYLGQEVINRRGVRVTVEVMDCEGSIWREEVADVLKIVRRKLKRKA